MALKMGCPVLFNLNNWADVRLSRGDKGDFLFINNYQDDPIEMVIEYRNKTMLGGNPVYIPARRGLILPIEWQLRKDIKIHYTTAEIIDISNDGSVIRLMTDPEEFYAEISLSGYSVDHSVKISEAAEMQRFTIQGNDGLIVLRKNNF
jgi:beta-galactosidase